MASRLTHFEIDLLKEMIGLLNKHSNLRVTVHSYRRLVEEDPKLRRVLDRFIKVDGSARAMCGRFQKAYTGLLDAVDKAVLAHIPPKV